MRGCHPGSPRKLDVAVGMDEPTWIAILAAVAASALTGLASVILLRIEWRRETDVRRSERRLEATERLLEDLGTLRSQASHSGPTDVDMDATKGLIRIQVALLRRYRVPRPVEVALQAIEAALPAVTSMPNMGARTDLDDASARFAQVALEQLAIA